MLLLFSLLRMGEWVGEWLGFGDVVLSLGFWLTTNWFRVRDSFLHISLSSLFSFLFFYSSAGICIDGILKLQDVPMALHCITLCFSLSPASTVCFGVMWGLYYFSASLFASFFSLLSSLFRMSAFIEIYKRKPLACYFLYDVCNVIVSIFLCQMFRHNVCGLVFFFLSFFSPSIL